MGPETSRPANRGDDWRESVLQALLYALTGLSVIAGPIVVIQTRTVGPLGLGMAAVVSLVLLAATFVRRLGFLVRTVLFLLAMYLFGASGLVRVGYVVGPTSVLVLVVVACGLLIGRGAMWIVLAVTTLTILAAGYVTVSTQGSYLAPAAMNVLVPANWARMALTFAVSAGVISLTVMYVVARVESALVERTRGLEQLRQEQARRALAQEQLDIARSQLVQSQKLEAIGTLAGGVAHDFNNSLTIVRGWLDLLRRTQAPAARAAMLDDALPEIEKAVQHATGTTRQLLAFGRRSVHTPRALRLQAEITSFEQTMRRLLPSDIELRTVVAADTPLVHADASLLNQALMNLAINARDAMPAGGTLQIEVGRLDALPSGLGSAGDAAPSAGWATITVRDSGSGMDAETAERAFEPFFTTKPEGKGTGLGLATVYGVVKQADGHVVLKSAPGNGTHVTLYLPGTSAEASAREPPTAEARHAKPACILVAEDEAGVRRIVVTVLEQAGHRVLAVADSDAGIALVDAHVGQIDLLCTDGVMPGIGVRHLIERFRKNNRRGSVLVCSGHLEEELVARGVKSGELAFLQKPFTPEELLHKTAALLARR